jgi:hypothetical protein
VISTIGKRYRVISLDAAKSTHSRNFYWFVRLSDGHVLRSSHVHEDGWRVEPTEDQVGEDEAVEVEVEAVEVEVEAVEEQVENTPTDRPPSVITPPAPPRGMVWCTHVGGRGGKRERKNEVRTKRLNLVHSSELTESQKVERELNESHELDEDV